VRDPEVGMKLAAAALFAALVSAIGIVAERRRAPLPWAWASASVLFVSQDWRYLQLRGGVLMATLLLAFVEVAFFVEPSRRRRTALVLIATLSSISYNGALVLFPMHVAGLASLVFLPDRAPLRARAIEPLLTAAGVLLGLVVNPYFDRQLSTFRFAFLNVWVIGRDSAGLFAGRENLEVSPFPFETLRNEWGWGVLLTLALVGAAVVAWRRARGARVERDELVYGALTLMGIALTARMLRLREYALPMGFVFFGVVAKRLPPWVIGTVRRRVTATVVALAVLAGVAERESKKTMNLIVQTHPAIDLFGGAREILESHAGAPVGNLVLGDGNLLLWEWPKVVVAQGGSPYFVYLHDRELYDDLRALRDVPADGAASAALDRMERRGTRLVSARAGLAFHEFAARHPGRLRRVFAHPTHRACLYEIVSP
jgi:hypothetical protein